MRGLSRSIGTLARPLAMVLGARQRVALASVGLLIALCWPSRPVARADEGWAIKSFDAQIAVEPDGALRVVETLFVDFGTLSKHGIYRDIPVVYDYDEKTNRVYDLSVESVTDANGRAHKYEVDREGSYLRIKIGDPDVTVSGPQSYRIAYRVRHALNGFADHDELFWNANGQWPVRTERVVATVALPGDGLQRVACYQGAVGSRQPCRSSSTSRGATFESTGTLPEGEQLTIVVGMRKGLVPEPQPKLVAKPRELAEFFEATPPALAGALLALVVVVGGLAWSWWRFGRDQRYTTLYYLSDNPSEETRPIFSSDPIVVEYEPPERLRPAQLGLILDESADTLDVTATIVDLAVRGYLHITEVPRGGLLGGILDGHDWELTRTDKDAGDLLGYEQTVLRGLFASGSPVRLSSLKDRFYTYLRDAEKSLYEDAMGRKWFARRPDRARAFWVVVGALGMALGAGLIVALGSLLGAGLVAVPVLLGGALLMVMAHWMPKRTARGREVLRRTLGFRQYVATAETDRQRFNEQQNLFAEYLPYAIVFRCVDKWARAFQDLDTTPATRSWYTGASYLGAADFSRGLQGFSSAVSSTIVSTPGGSGGSGFSSGGAGGGGGGGGGGSW